MNCQDFQIDHAAAEKLSDSARVHAESCPECSDFLFAQLRVAGLLGDLKRVEAPADFTFQVRARIAREKERRDPVPFFSSLRFILPFASVLLIISALALGGLLMMGNEAAEDNLAVSDPISSTPLQPRPSSTVPGASPAVNFNSAPQAAAPEPSSTEIAARTVSRVRNSEKRTVSVDDEGGGSRDLAVTSVAPVIQPEFNANRSVVIVPPSGTNSVRDLSEILKISGITVEKTIVVSIAKNSLAERSGIQIGDDIDAVNGKKVTAGAVSGDSLNIRTITVIRNGENVEIVLKN